MEGRWRVPPVGLAIPVDEKRPPRRGKDAVPTRGHALRAVTGVFSDAFNQAPAMRPISSRHRAAWSSCWALIQRRA